MCNIFYPYIGSPPVLTVPVNLQAVFLLLNLNLRGCEHEALKLYSNTSTLISPFLVCFTASIVLFLLCNISALPRPVLGDAGPRAACKEGRLAFLSSHVLPLDASCALQSRIFDRPLLLCLIGLRGSLCLASAMLVLL